MDARVKPAHDDWAGCARLRNFAGHSGAMRKHRTRNPEMRCAEHLEIPDRRAWRVVRNDGGD
jgi:hypothetical protein